MVRFSLFCLFFSFTNIAAFILPALNGISKTAHRTTIHLHGRVAKKEDEASKDNIQVEGDDDMITIPFTGLIGTDDGNLFTKPLQEYDPLKDTDNLPGEDGSDEKVAAIQERIKKRVEELKRLGQWDEGDSFGEDPLSQQPIYQTMAEQIRVIRPFESTSDFFLNYLLVLFTSVSLSLFLYVLRDLCDGFMAWWVNTDFEGGIFSEIARQYTT